MATTNEFLSLALDALSLTDDIVVKRMMGEYLLYCKGKLVGGLYDDRLLCKPTKAASEYFPHPKTELPYEGAKPMIRILDLSDKQMLKSLLERSADELPLPKKRK